MQPPPTNRLAQLESASQDALATFLVTDIDLAFTMLELARTHRLAEHRERSLEHANTALHSIRHFEERITDPERRRKVHARTDELEAAINAFGISKQTAGGIGP